MKHIKLFERYIKKKLLKRETFKIIRGILIK